VVEFALLTFLQAKERLLDMREGEPRFLFGSHFSTPMYVVYFLVRIYPKFMMRFTSGTFDLPDRLFHSVADTWRGVVRHSSCCFHIYIFL
jgi:factor associated with neutral sphingomyelinase activation